MEICIRKGGIIGYMYYIAAEEYGMRVIVFKYERFRQWSKPAFLKKILDKKLYNVYTKNNGGLLCRL
jgi:hypothetical protein